MENKNLYEIMDVLNSHRISKPSFIGSVACLVLDKQIFRSNSEVGEFASLILEVELPKYILRSRTILLARLCRELDLKDKKSIQYFQRRVLFFIKNIVNNDDSENIQSSNKKNDSLSNMSKWITGILKKDNS